MNDWTETTSLSQSVSQIQSENKVAEKKKKDPNRLSVERIYQKKTQLEHILLRPDTYIGSVEPVTQVIWKADYSVHIIKHN